MSYATSIIDGSLLNTDGSLNNQVVLPSWTTSNRPSNPSNGTMGINTTNGTVEAYINNRWFVIANSAPPPAPGSSAAVPATSASQIRAAGVSTNGDYWYQPSSGLAPIQLYTNFTNAPAGKGYVLVARGRESADWWNTNGQNSNSLTSTSLTTNTPVATLSNTFINALIGSSWNGMRFLTNRLNNSDSFLFVGTTSTTFSWAYFNQSPSSVNATVSRYNGLFLSSSLAYTVSNTNQWTDTYNVNGSLNDCNRSFTWTWANHGGQQGWSGGDTCTPAGSYQAGSERHSIQLVNCYIEC